MRAIVMVALAACAFAVAACEDKPSTDTPAKTEADNTKKNERDRDATQTPGDQKEGSADLGITQTIRQDIVKSDSLSMDAKNVKVMTADGVVTLRGPVKNEQEKTDIGKMASAVTGVKRVDNQLEVKTN